jgi:protein involved in polysaccharide export with SLBB domain
MQSLPMSWLGACVLIALAVFGAQAHIAHADDPTEAAVTAPPQPAATAAIEASYALGSGDKLRVIVFGEDDLGGEFVIDDAGFVRLPLVGQITAGGRTVRQLEEDIAARLGAQYLKDPRVSIEILSFRPFYIIGEVNKPGEYPFVVNMSVLNAVAMAGGYTYRANESSVYIRRKGAPDEEKFPADDSTKLRPGDIVNVVERWF